MSGSLPHTIAITNHTLPNANSTGYTPFDLRSDEDKNIAALNARNAKASSDFVVTISEEGQALSQHSKPQSEEMKAQPLSKNDIQKAETVEVQASNSREELESIQSIEEKHQGELEDYQDNDAHTGHFLDDIV
ncbi:hypothetical protein I8J31_10630 [Marinomonas sp. C1424]|uniref:Uncharacterized protein n=2 Tax=Marinomonas transparens TaxID=2795388 RepID=A0A934JVM6_9GAMM|nr:hypothetical protein [Marinomonas transparens]